MQTCLFNIHKRQCATFAAQNVSSKLLYSYHFNLYVIVSSASNVLFDPFFALSIFHVALWMYPVIASKVYKNKLILWS